MKEMNNKDALQLYKEKRLGEENFNKDGTLMKIIEYINCRSIWVEFQDEYRTKVHTSYVCFKNGGVNNPYHLSVYDIGYLGVGKYNCKNFPKVYDIWHGMLQRCYDPYHINKQLSYKDCFVCKEWHCFQNFAKWYEENYYECNEEKMCIDKDILYKGNKIYSPENCIFVPERINMLFVKASGRRGIYPIGVSYHKRNKTYGVNCNVYNECLKKNTTKYLGCYNSIEKAFQCYKQFKENYIKQIADEYKNLIPKKLYEAMYNYKIEIND